MFTVPGCDDRVILSLQILPHTCLMLTLECSRLSLILTTVLHLLLMVSLHTAAICAPVRANRLITVPVVVTIIR